MKKDIDYTNLVTKAQKLVHDGRLQMAAAAEIPVQEIEYPDGSVYTIKLVAEFKSEPYDITKEE